jgi:hypothetical protein
MRYCCPKRIRATYQIPYKRAMNSHDWVQGHSHRSDLRVPSRLEGMSNHLLNALYVVIDLLAPGVQDFIMLLTISISREEGP